jgi:hypothetical protein
LAAARVTVRDADAIAIVVLVARRASLAGITAVSLLALAIRRLAIHEHAHPVRPAIEGVTERAAGVVPGASVTRVAELAVVSRIRGFAGARNRLAVLAHAVTIAEVRARVVTGELLGHVFFWRHVLDAPHILGSFHVFAAHIHVARRGHVLFDAIDSVSEGLLGRLVRV